MRSFIPLIASGVLLALNPANAQEIPPNLLVDALSGGIAGSDVENSRDVAVADFNGDTFLDVFVVNVDEDNSLYFGDGAGGFTKDISVNPLIHDSGRNSRGVAVGDIDGDLDIDVFVANSAAQPNLLYRNNGNGFFTRVTTGLVVTETDNSRHGVFFDMDGDTDLDLFVANFNGQDNDLFTNDGAGNFTKVVDPANDAASDGGISYDAAVADIDGDTDLDLFVTNHDGLVGGPGTVNFLYRNDGSGGFTRITGAANHATLDVNNSLGCTFGDVDGDNDVDLYVANDELDKNNFYLNDGTGVFTRVFTGPLVTNMGNSISCEFFDIDGQHGPDLFVANRAGEGNCLFMNNGRGGPNGFDVQPFGPLEPSSGETGNSYGFAFGDLDGDGDHEVVVANQGEANRFYDNDGPQWIDLANHLVGVGGIPTLGGTGTLEPSSWVILDIDQGPPAGMSVLFVGFGTLYAPFMGGVMVPAPVMQLGGLPLNGTGSLTLFGIMPNLPSGFAFILQAWMPDATAVAGASATNALKLIVP
jgi:hypothetical protein